MGRRWVKAAEINRIDTKVFDAFWRGIKRDINCLGEDFGNPERGCMRRL